MTKRRVAAYTALACLFGIASWYGYAPSSCRFVYPFISSIPSEWRDSMYACAYADWLFPAVLVALYESYRTKRPLFASLACSGFWVVAMVAFYGCYAWDVIVVGANPQLAQMHIGSPSWPFYAWRFFVDDILRELLQWLPLALVGGPLVGFAVGWLYVRLFTSGVFRRAAT